ncbi:hypothetical protein K439DRAFT_1544989 [Ramaria rubella]|nr:hypothetical protein K439DRAFT_1544989 [Ramaria rubella]
MWMVTICMPRQGIVYELEWVRWVGTQGVGTKPILKVVVGFTTMMAMHPDTWNDCFEAELMLMSHLSTGSSVGTDHRPVTINSWAKGDSAENPKAVFGHSLYQIGTIMN